MNTPSHEHARYQRIAAELTQAEATEDRRLRLRVDGDSMMPLVQPGDVMLVEPVLGADLRRGDVVAICRPSGDVVTHRVVALRDDGYVTKGDNRRHADPVWSETDLLGRVTAIERGARYIDLNERRRHVTNGVVGWSSWLELHLFRAARRVRRYMPVRLTSRRHRILRHMLRMPFDAVRRLLSLANR